MIVKAKYIKYKEWQEWYAWRPVFYKGLLYWGIKLSRRYVDVGNMWTEYKWQYCLPGDEW